MARGGAFGARIEDLAMSKTLVLGLLVAALVVAGLLLSARPAHAAEYTVTETGDGSDTSPGDGQCGILSRGSLDPSAPTPCTLRAAMEEANATAGADTIKFNIPDDPNVPGDEVKTIRPVSYLPYISDPVTIDGYSQPGASENTIQNAREGTNAVLKIELDGTNSGSAYGLQLYGTNNVVRGLVINRFSQVGISYGSRGGNKVEGNFIGTDASGTQALSNGFGVDVYGFGSTIGGTSPEARNLISGNNYSGIALGTATNNKILGNLIGTQKDGASALGNGGYGVVISNGGYNTISDSASNNTIGGVEFGAANIIAFNGNSGVLLYEDDTAQPILSNRILYNYIFSNAGLGIDIRNDGRTANDPKDRDKGANGLQNFPVLSSATSNPDGSGKITGTLNSTPRKSFTIQFFYNFEGEDEGRWYIGEKKVKTNRKGKASFTLPTGTIIVGDAITATATGTGGTSEFSDPVVVT